MLHPMRYIPLLFMFSISCAAQALDRSIIDASGLPLPRFVSLRSNEINMRAGPGTEYPIKWTYRKKYLPVEVLEEFGHWRHVRDRQGEKGWIHKNLLSGGRSAVLLENPTILTIAPREDAAVTIKAAKGTVARMPECQEEWCALEIQGRIGWAPKSKLWGAYESETFKRN